MEENTNTPDGNNPIDDKRKQKAGLNAVRPDDYLEQKFKTMAKDKNLSQTEMFERIFINYIKNDREERLLQALNVEGEINLISKDLNNILEHFKSITEKAQNTIISIETNAKQTEHNLNIDIDTLKKRIKELEDENTELKKSNGAFNEVKKNLEKKINGLEATLKDREEELLIVSERKTESENQLALTQRENILLKREMQGMEDTVRTLQGDIRSRDTKIQSLESVSESMSNTIRNMETLKKSEISSVEAKYKVMIAELEAKLKTSEEQKEREIQLLQTSLKKEYEADKKMALSDSKLELAEMKTQYSEVLLELNSVKNSVKETGKLKEQKKS